MDEVSGRQAGADAIRGHSEEDYPVCDPCQLGETLLRADGYCVNCCEYLCVDCFNRHLRSKQFRQHELLGGKEMPKAVSGLDHTCPTYCDKGLEYFCQTCDQLECHVCRNAKHNECKDVINFLW